MELERVWPSSHSWFNLWLILLQWLQYSAGMKINKCQETRSTGGLSPLESISGYYKHAVILYTNETACTALFSSAFVTVKSAALQSASAQFELHFALRAKTHISYLPLKLFKDVCAYISSKEDTYYDLDIFKQGQQRYIVFFFHVLIWLSWWLMEHNDFRA